MSVKFGGDHRETAIAEVEAIEVDGRALETARMYQFDGQPLFIRRGQPLPVGTTRTPVGINFALICRHATAVWLVLSKPCHRNSETEIPIDPLRYRTGDIWHLQVEGLPDEFCYGYRVDGPTGGRHRYDPSTVLLDPLARSLSCGQVWGFPCGVRRRGLATKSRSFRHPDDISPRIAREDSLIYELHVRGYTVDSSSGVAHPGTFAGLTEKIPYLKELGVTAVELLPIDEFDENDCPFVNPITGEKLRNLWGYNTVAFAAPKAAYASNPAGASAWAEFCKMVHEFHQAGIEVILDVVFNHTAEGNEHGNTYSFRGLDNDLYYMLDEKGDYLNFSGCGNTFNGNHPVVRGLILTFLHHKVAEAGVDGFRFDLASVLGRDEKGRVLINPPVIERIGEEPILRDVKLIAEPWDAAGLYQLGSFPGGPRWSAWNGRFRDDVRRFWRGDAGAVSDLATRLCGSDDVFAGQSPRCSINFITCHDGFTLNDLVSYNQKHNHANGENNRDGMNENLSWNCGVEGPTDDASILALRRRQARNLIATLMLSQGTPMLLAGDEFLRTQNGNNNAWCQDNKTSWVDWKLVDKNADFLRFTKKMIALRMRHPVLRRASFVNRPGSGPTPDVVWHGVEPCKPDFSGFSRSIALAYDGRRCDPPGVIDRDLYIAMSAYWKPLEFTIPSSPSGRRWRLAVDTSLASPDDARDLDQGPVVSVGSKYHVGPRSLIVLVSEE